VHVTNDTLAKMESWGKRGILFGEQAMGIFIVTGSKLDEIVLGRSLSPISVIGLGKALEFWDPFGGIRRLSCGARPQRFGSPP